MAGRRNQRSEQSDSSESPYRSTREQAPDALLVIDDLHVRYGRSLALDGLSLSVGEGEVVALLGANGAGKSTTLKAVSGLVPIASGRIVYRDINITRLAAHKIVELGIAHVPEGRRVFPDLTLLENLKLGAYVHGRNVARADLDRVFGHFPILEDRHRQRAGTLSGGEQQMLAIGRALMTRPQLLLLDEPSTGLAPTIVSTIAGIIRDINQEDGVTILIVEQNARLAFGLADRAYVLSTGRVAVFGDSSTLADDERVQAAYLGG